MWSTRDRKQIFKFGEAYRPPRCTKKGGYVGP